MKRNEVKFKAIAEIYRVETLRKAVVEYLESELEEVRDALERQLETRDLFRAQGAALELRNIISALNRNQQ